MDQSKPPFNQRFSKLLELLGTPQYKFAEKTGINRESINKYCKDVRPREDAFVRIEQAFPDVNLEWLKTGIGSVFKSREVFVEEPKVQYKTSSNQVIGNVNYQEMLVEYYEDVEMILNLFAKRQKTIKSLLGR